MAKIITPERRCCHKLLYLYRPKTLYMSKIKFFIFFVVSITLAVVGWFANSFAEPFAAAQSVESPAKGLYTFAYRGDYGFDDFLAEGGAPSADKMAEYITSFLTRGLVSTSPRPNDFGCSVMSVDNEHGGHIMARNFDWEKEVDSDIVVVHTYPTNGYASVATSYVDFLGFGEDYAPRSLMDKMALLAAIYVPLDGMNEAGLSVADLIVGDGEMIDQQSARADLTITAAIRLLLDKAATVEEALALLSQYDIHSDIGQAHHLAIADKSGHEVVVEWVANKMIVTESPVCTNHYLAYSGSQVVAGNSLERYAALRSMLDDNKTMSVEQATKSIECVVAPSTRWTAIFDSHAMEVTYYQRGDFQRPYIATIK